MKVLYAIQGTGNGHLSRARDIIPVIEEYARLDILISGTQAEVELGHPVKYRKKGLGFVFGKNGGIDILSTYRNANISSLMKEINTLPVKNYDLVINDFEPVSAWACRRKNVPCISLSHQASLLSKQVPRPSKKDPAATFLLENYAPTDFQISFHFAPYDEHIFTPVIRKQVRDTETDDKGHYTVYLPAFDDKKLIKKLSFFDDIRWEIFSKHTRSTYQKGNITVRTVSNGAFLKSMAESTGVLCGAGFETPAETLFLGKKLMVIPMKSQYEQQCNAAALKQMGVPVIKNLKEKNLPKIGDWLSDGKPIPVFYPDQTRTIVKQIFEGHIARILKDNEHENNLLIREYYRTNIPEYETTD
ncbi:glycosyltransferase family protein [Prolixibacter sp. SD074]|uniref:glycosyltransferase family protein n=1 Tax=Prolixibacter sp. SD074 TaxID=2652391 RepID=UPI001273BE8D|nr:glycosyltransferase family protein [Prolixibacter sp. SD074]GET28064.1 glycosyl transferase [Prolixibacter sp. SD074]